MAVDVVTEVEIARPREEVAAFAADPSNATAFRAQFLGRTLEYTYEVRELDRARRFVMATAQGPFPMETTYSWEDAAPGRTKMSFRNRGEPSGFAAITVPVMTRAMRRANQADLRRLKALLES